jgi:phosphoglucosamine mutase
MATHATTGDGLLTALHVSEQLASTGSSIAELAGIMTRLPQVLVNVSGVDKSRVSSDPAVIAAVAEAQTGLAGVGRVLLRPSGTESLVRVMVEAPTAERADAVARGLADVVERALSLP